MVLVQRAIRYQHFTLSGPPWAALITLLPAVFKREGLNSLYQERGWADTYHFR